MKLLHLFVALLLTLFFFGCNSDKESLQIETNITSSSEKKVELKKQVSDVVHPKIIEVQEMDQYKARLDTHFSSQEVKQTEELTPKFTNAKKVINAYSGDLTIKNKMKTYVDKISEAILDKESKLNGLEFIRLQNCFQDEKTFKKALQQDIEEENIKEKFSQYIVQPQYFWLSTIAMKLKLEGESEELLHFFDCNQTSLLEKPTKTSSPFSATDRRRAIDQKDNILKNYVKIFENQPTPDLSNQKAIDFGLIEKEWIKENEIQTPFGTGIEIKGMPKGGMKIIYTGIPSGDECVSFIHLNFFDTIYFDSKPFEGIDYILVNNDKVKMNYTTRKFVQKVCNKQDKNTISFVKENVAKKHSYKPKEVNNAYGIAKKIKIIDKTQYGPDTFTFSPESNKIYVFGNTSNVYDKKFKTLNSTLSEALQHTHHAALSPDGSIVAITKYNEILVIDTSTNEVIKVINDLPENSMYVMKILSDNKTIVSKGKKLYFINLENEKAIEIMPYFIEKDKEYFTPSISAVGESLDGSIIYIGSSYGDVERWKVDTKFFSSEISQLIYIDTLRDKSSRDIGVIMHDPRNGNHLIIGANEKIQFWDLKNKNIIKTLKSDLHMKTKYLEMSHDKKYLMASSEFGIFIWKLGEDEQYEFLHGDFNKGAVFVSNKEFISIGKEIELWSLEL